MSGKAKTWELGFLKLYQWTLDNIKANNNKVSYIGRSPDASPATGYAKRHISQQKEIIKKVLE